MVSAEEREFLSMATDAIGRCHGSDEDKARAVLAVLVPAMLEQVAGRLDAEVERLDSGQKPYHKKGLQAAARLVRQIAAAPVAPGEG